MDSQYAQVLTTFPMLEGFTVHGVGVLFEREAGPSRLLGELAVLAGVNRLVSARAAEPSVVIEWDALALRRIITSDAQLSERIFRETYRSVVEDQHSLIGALSQLNQVR